MRWKESERLEGGDVFGVVQDVSNVSRKVTGKLLTGMVGAA